MMSSRPSSVFAGLARYESAAHGLDLYVEIKRLLLLRELLCAVRFSMFLSYVYDVLLRSTCAG